MTVTLPEAENFVLARWILLWGATTPFVFAQEDEPSTVRRGEVNWVEVNIVDEPADEQQTLAPTGARKFLRRAAVSITIHVPSNKGTSGALQLAQQARAVFEGTKFDGLSFYTAQVERLGSAPPEYLILVTCPFDYVETK